MSRMRRLIRSIYLAVALAGGVSVATAWSGQARAATHTAIVLETVSNYQFTSGGSTANDTDANTEGQGFWDQMTAN